VGLRRPPLGRRAQPRGDRRARASCSDVPLLLLAGYRADEFPADSIHREWRARMLSQRDAEAARLRPRTLEEAAIATPVTLAGGAVARCSSHVGSAGMVARALMELAPTIDELVEASILSPFHYIDQGYYDFRHQLLRDAIYGNLPPSQLRRFHAQAAEFGMTL